MSRHTEQPVLVDTETKLPPMKRRRFREAATFEESESEKIHPHASLEPYIPIAPYDIIPPKTEYMELQREILRLQPIINDTISQQPLRLLNKGAFSSRKPETEETCQIIVPKPIKPTIVAKTTTTPTPSGKKKKEKPAVKDRFTVITSFDWNIDPVIHPCPYLCGRDFDSLNGLEAHVKQQHAEEVKTSPKPMPTFTFSCRFCTYVCQYKQRLITHLNKEHSSEFHKKEKPVVEEKLEIPQWNLGECMRHCPYMCGKEYSSLAGLKSHLKTHHVAEQNSNPKPLPEFVFRCQYCDTSFPARTLLVSHLNKEHVTDYYAAANNSNKE